MKRHLQKLTNATCLSFVVRALLQEHSQFQAKITCDADFRQAARAIKLRTAKVLSSKDLESARAERAAGGHNARGDHGPHAAGVWRGPTWRATWSPTGCGVWRATPREWVGVRVSRGVMRNDEACSVAWAPIAPAFRWERWWPRERQKLEHNLER